MSRDAGSWTVIHCPPRPWTCTRTTSSTGRCFTRTCSATARPTGRFWRGLARWCRRKPALASFVGATAFLLILVLIGSPIAIYRINHALKRTEAGEERSMAE